MTPQIQLLMIGMYMQWIDPTSITTYLDGNQFFVMNTSGVEPYYPFNEEFFFIFNVAMGGTLGGDIDPNFTGIQWK